MPAADQLFDEPLVYVTDFERGFRREGAGEAVRFLSNSGRPVRAQRTLERLRAIGLPPAYQNSWYCLSPRGHIQAIGYDDRGRRQYRYHPAFRAAAEADKFDRLAAFGRALPAIRRRIESGLARRDLSRERVIAAVVRLLDLTQIRVGNRQYAKDNGSFGVTTLRRRHATLARDTLRLEFVGKSGKAHRIAIGDRRLMGVVRACDALPGQQLFQYRDADGAVHSLTSGDVNGWLADIADDITAKHFRTWHASVLAFEAIAAARGAARLKDVLALVADRLGNTPAVARKSYIHPVLIEILAGDRPWDPAWSRLPRGAAGLSRGERGFLAFVDMIAPTAA